MTIYTRKGDKGFTHRPDGQAVRKSEAFCQALGTIDELNSVVGWCIQSAAQAGAEDVRAALQDVQRELMASGALLAAAGTTARPNVALDPASVDRMEHQIDAAWARAGDLTHFILPGGCELACRLHVARTVCRRAERCVVAAVDSGVPSDPLVLRHLNRLSDLLFALARLANHLAGQDEQLWPGRPAK